MARTSACSTRGGYPPLLKSITGALAGPHMAKRVSPAPTAPSTELVIITGMSGSGKGTVLKAFEDLGYYSVDNLPIDLVPKFAELVKSASGINRAALVIDIREGAALGKLPATLRRVSRLVPTRLIFLEADEAVLIRRFSETRRPHPLGIGQSVAKSIRREREQLEPIRRLAATTINTTRFNVHELRETIHNQFRGQKREAGILIQVTSFGYRHGVPTDSDLVFDVRFLPNPNYIPAFKKLTGKHPSVARYIRSFPANAGVYRADFRSARLPAAALHRRRQKLPDDCVRLHRRPSSKRADRE